MIKKDQDTTLLSKVYQTVNQSLTVSESQESSECMDFSLQASDSSRHNNSQICDPTCLPNSTAKSTTTADAHGNSLSNSANASVDMSTSLAQLKEAEMALYKKWGALLGVHLVPDGINDNPNDDDAKDTAGKANSSITSAGTGKARRRTISSNSYNNDRSRKMQRGIKRHNQDVYQLATGHCRYYTILED